LYAANSVWFVSAQLTTIVPDALEDAILFILVFWKSRRVPELLYGIWLNE
jgi:hypothetical protein